MINLGDEFWAAIIGALVGSASGAIPAYLLAIKASREALTKEREERARTQHDRVFRVFLVLSECLADAVDHLRAIEDQLRSNSVADGIPHPVSASIQPIANLEFIGHFEAKSDDLLAFIEGGEVEFAQTIRLHVKQYNSIVECLKKYTHLKESFSAYVAAQDGLNLSVDGRISGHVDGFVAQRIMMSTAAMESLIVETRSHLRQTVEDLIGLAQQFGPVAEACTPKGATIVGFAEQPLEDLRAELRGLPKLR